MAENEITKEVVDACVSIHRELGPGLLETVYEVVLTHELEGRGFKCRRQVPIPIGYRGIRFEEGFRADIIVNDLVILELKSVQELTSVHRKQLQTYLKLSGLKVGLLLNFGTALMRDGIVRAVNGFTET